MRLVRMYLQRAVRLKRLAKATEEADFALELEKLRSREAIKKIQPDPLTKDPAVLLPFAVPMR